MPALVAIAIRYIILAAVQLGLWSLAEKYGIPLINGAISAVAQFFGATQQQAQDIVANEFLRMAEDVGIFAATLKTKLPLKVADAIGFTTRGYATRTFPQALEALLGKAARANGAATVATADEAAALAQSVSVSRGVTFDQVNKVVGFALKIAAFPIGFFYAFAQYVDYAAWNNPYQGTMEKLLSYIGINPDNPMPKARTISADVWQRIYSTVEQLKPSGISYPFSDVDKPYSRENLADIVDEISTNLAAAGGTASYKNVLAAVMPLLQNITYPAGGLVAPAGSASTGGGTPATPPAGTVPTQIQIYTGVISQGTLGLPQEFVARPDDMIQNQDELVAAAKNNLASFVSALPGRFYYELSIASTYRTKAGTSVKGDAVKVVSGYYKNGNPRYKTIYYKFAIMKLGVTDENGRNIKLGTINLGPINVVDFRPTQTDLAAAQDTIKSETFTSDLSSVTTVLAPGVTTVTSTPPANPNPPTGTTQPNVPSQTPTQTPAPAPTPPPPETISQTVTAPQYRANGANGVVTVRISGSTSAYVLGTIPNGTIVDANTGQAPYTQGGGTWVQVKFNNLFYPVLLSELAPVGSASSGSSLTPLQQAQKAAASLSDFYAASGQALPSLENRSYQYQALGLGPASTYAGTAEQNNRLLAQLKTLAGAV